MDNETHHPADKAPAVVKHLGPETDGEADVSRETANLILDRGRMVYQQLKQAQSEIAKLRAALEQAEDYFDGRADVIDGAYGEPRPNREMNILSEIREALGSRP